MHLKHIRTQIHTSNYTHKLTKDIVTNNLDIQDLVSFLLMQDQLPSFYPMHLLMAELGR